MDDTVGRFQFYFPQKQLDVIIGTLLGDGRLEARSKGIRAYTARLRVHHGEKQKEYVWWKYLILKDIVSCEPREIIWKNPKRNLREVSWYFHTRSLEELRVIRDYFYRDGRKLIPTGIGRLITPRVLAVWAMDDGAYTNPGFNLNTQAFSAEEQNKLRIVLKDKFGVGSVLRRDRSQWKIALNQENAEILFRLIKPYLISQMTYKIGIPVSTDSANRRMRVVASMQ